MASSSTDVKATAEKKDGPAEAKQISPTSIADMFYSHFESYQQDTHDVGHYCTDAAARAATALWNDIPSATMNHEDESNKMNIASSMLDFASALADNAKVDGVVACEAIQQVMEFGPAVFGCFPLLTEDSNHPVAANDKTKEVAKVSATDIPPSKGFSATSSGAPATMTRTTSWPSSFKFEIKADEQSESETPLTKEAHHVRRLFITKDDEHIDPSKSKGAHHVRSRSFDSQTSVSPPAKPLVKSSPSFRTMFGQGGKPLGDITNYGIDTSCLKKNATVQGLESDDSESIKQRSIAEVPPPSEEPVSEEGYEVSITKHRQLQRITSKENATKIQRCWQAYKAQRDYSLFTWSVISIQSHIRRRLAIQKYQQLQLGRAEASAIAIQSCFRMWVALRVKRNFVSNTIKLQSAFRRQLTILRVNELRFITSVASPGTISVFKRHFNFLKLNALREFRTKYEEQTAEAACMTLQKWWRQVLPQRKILEVKRKIIISENKAAMAIQKMFRGYQRDRSAIQIQTCIRRHLAKCLVKTSKQEKMQQEMTALQNAAATAIQSLHKEDAMMDALEGGSCGGLMPSGEFCLFLNSYS